VNIGAPAAVGSSAHAGYVKCAVGSQFLQCKRKELLELQATGMVQHSHGPAIRFPSTNQEN
jgi:hypothetical protein